MSMQVSRLSEEELFVEVCSSDFLSFNFSGRGYKDQLTDAIAKTEVSEDYLSDYLWRVTWCSEKLYDHERGWR